MIPKIASSVIAALLFITLVFGSWYTVDQGEKAVVLRNGAIIGESEPGLHFKLPLFDSVEHISVQDRNRQYAKIEAYSQDQQPADLTISVSYKITDPKRVYALYGGEGGLTTRILDTRVPTNVENVFGQYDAINAVQKSTQLNIDLTTAVRKAMGDAPIQIQAVQIMNKVFSRTYEIAVENRMQAIVQQEQALAEKQKRITNADAAAYEVNAQADAHAHAVKVTGEAEASAIKARGDALRDNPNLVALTAVEKWKGDLPTTMVPGATLPFINVGR